MYRSGSGRSGPSSSSSSHRLKESGSAGPRASRSGTSGPGPGRGRPPPPPPPPAAASAAASPPRCASPRPPPPPPPPPPRRHRSPSGHRGASRRSPSPHRSRRLPSPPGGAGGPGGGRGGRRGSEHGDGSGRRRSPSLRSESSLEQSLRITVGNDRYCIGTPERRRLPDRLGSPIDNLSDRDDMADGPIFTRGLSCSRGLERYPSHEDQPSSPFMRHDEDYRNRDVFLHRSDYSPHYGRREELPRGSDREGDKLRKSSYPSRPEERGREIKRPRYEKDEKMHGVSGEHQGFSSGTRNYRRRSRSRSRSPSPSYLNEEFRELDRARRKREEEERSRNLNHDVSGSGYVIPGLTNALQTSEPRYTYRPEEIPSMPKKSILKKRVEMEVESPIQPEGFSSSPAPSKDLPLLSSHSSLPQSNSTAPFASEVENFLKRFNKDSVVESANKELRDGLYEWSPLSGAPKDAFTFEEKFGSFLSHKEKIEAKSEPADRHTDFLLPHERASQDGSGFSRILGMMADSVSAQEKRRRSFPDIEDEEKFLYGDEDEDIKTESLPVQKPPVSCGNEIISQKVSPPPTPAPAVKLDPLEEPNAEYAKIHDLLKTIGLDIGVAEIGKLAVRTQERLHGKKLASRSPDRRSADLRRLDHWDLRRSRSDTRSPESGQQRSASPAISFQQSKDASSLQKSEYAKNKPVGQDMPPCAPEQPLPPVSLIPSVPPAPANLPPTPTSVSQYQIPNYSQFTATQMPQNYPPPTMAPPGYDAYGHYMAYAAPGWPMYPPTQQPNPTLPEAHGLLTMAMSANPTRPNLRVIETVSMGKNVPDLKRDGSVLVHVPTTPAHSKVPLRLSSHNLKSTTEKMSDEKNRAAQKQKVIEEREKLKNEREARQKKLYYLKTELDRLRKQQGEMLRKKRREKDGHKDPLLVEVNRLQENIMKEISELHKESDAAEKKQSELDKVAQILGINIFEKPRKPSVETKDSSEKNSKSENAKGVEKASSSNKESKPANEKSRGRSPKPAESSTQSSKHPFQLANIYEYYDAGNHWCKDCNTICGTMFDFFTHMHNKKHRQTLDPYNRPWASKTQSETKQDSIKRIDKITVPAKGSEFLIPITGYYCQLCHEFFGDQISAEQHVKSHPHNEKYKKYIDENPLYEERRNLDRQAGLAVVLETERRRQSELKRKLVEKQKEEKDEKKPKIIKKEETKNIPELGEGANETQGKIDSSGRKMGIKLKLKKEEKEEKKEEKKEEPKKESSQMSFGKFSWKKTERGEDKGLGVAIPKEEGVEGIKEENKCQSGKLHAKPIEIKLSGKTVIPHTSPWTPVVSTSTQAKILPNLPVPTMIFRKSTTATVSKPPPLNTFLSIKSSGATTKPLPVVKETNTDLVLPPDIISKAFGGEEVILKGSEEDLKAAEKNESSQTSDIPPHPPLPPAVQQAAVIPADEVAPGVSESEQTMLAMLVRPPPPPPPSTAFSEQAKKVEKRNSCLATANAKDLYDIFYSSGGKGSADSKLASSALPNGENSNLAKPADLPANPRASNSSSSFKEDQNVATEVSQVLSAKRGSEMEKTVTQQTSVPHSEMSTDIENGIQKDRGQKFQTLSSDVQTKSKEEDSWQCNTQVAGSWVLGENPAEMNKKTLQPELSERSVTELPETKTASGVQMPAEMGLVDVASREQAGRQEFCDLQKTEVQGKVGQDDTNKTAVTKTNVPGTLEKYEEMKEVNAVKPELSLEHPKTLLPETRNEIQTLGNSHLVEEKLNDSSRTASKTDSPQLLCGSQNTSKENVLVAVMTEQNSTDTPLKDAKLNSVALEVPQPGVHGETPRISETQNKILELTRSPGECDTSRTSNGEEQVMTTSSCSESGWELSSTPNIEMKSGSDTICASEFTEIQPETCLTDTETRNSTSAEAQEKIRPEPSGRAVLHNQTQRQGVAWLVNACSANIVELRSSVELVVEVEKKSLGHTGSDVILDDIFAKRDAKEVGTAGFSRTCSDLVQESAVALSADVCVEHLSEEAVHSLEKKCEVIRTSAANSDFRLNTAHSGFKTEQSESLSPNVSVDHKKDSLRSENVKRNETLSEKAELKVKSTDTNLANTKGKCEHLSILSAGLLHKNMEEVSKLEAVASIRLESSKVSKADIGKPVNETEITDVAALTSGTREDKLCTQVSQTAVSQRGLQSSNSDSTEVGMPVLEMQGISPVSEILLQAEESKGGAAEMPSLSCDGGSTESQASGCVETFLPGLKETHGKNGGSGGKGVCTIQTKKTEQTETADSSLEATTNSGIAESVAESPVG